MPEDPESTDWTLYGLNPLKEKLSVFEQKQAVCMKAGHGNVDSQYYQSEYLPIYNTINDINFQISKVNNEIELLKSSQNEISAQMATIINVVAMENNFTKEQLAELSTFIREDELNSENFIVTDIMSDTRCLKQYLHNLCIDTGIMAKSNHKIRKTYISSLFDLGININTIKEQAGHEDERTSLHNYCFDQSENSVLEMKLESAMNKNVYFKSVNKES